ncbi:bacillithiol biosynthesis deacetylase BshB2 [Paenibacillus sp. EC2-1]|uniref:bacillithiol biosynthesis deacetylase BshB2 n=1 Tax=Paenibacillus sp. EC2-1 TaxID=3388665 RepID=UPI003BEEB54A
MNQRILVVLPHPDDEAFGLSGTLAKHIDQGDHVTYACLTLGEMGRNMGTPLIANRITLPSIRKVELEESCRAIGIQDLRMLGFHDKTIEFEDPEFLDGVIDQLLKEIQPTLVYTFYPGYSVHPDHDATGAAVVRTIQKLPKQEQPTVLCIAFARNCEEALGKADVSIDVTAYIEAKMNSIKSHRSQFQAAELLGSKQMSPEEINKRFARETFWTYRFE